MREQGDGSGLRAGQRFREDSGCWATFLLVRNILTMSWQRRTEKRKWGALRDGPEAPQARPGSSDGVCFSSRSARQSSRQKIAAVHQADVGLRCWRRSRAVRVASKSPCSFQGSTSCAISSRVSLARSIIFALLACASAATTRTLSRLSSWPCFEFGCALASLWRRLSGNA